MNATLALVILYALEDAHAEIKHLGTYPPIIRSQQANPNAPHNAYERRVRETITEALKKIPRSAGITIEPGEISYFCHVLPVPCVRVAHSSGVSVTIARACRPHLLLPAVSMACYAWDADVRARRAAVDAAYRAA